MDSLQVAIERQSSLRPYSWGCRLSRRSRPTAVKREREDDDEEEEEEEEEPTPPHHRRRTETAEETQVSEESSSEETLKAIVLTKLCSNDEETLEAAVEKLGSLLYAGGDKKNRAEMQKLLFQIGGHLAVVRVMKERVHNKNIQRSSIIVLMNASYQNADMKPMIALVGGFEAIVTAMETFPKESKVLTSAFLALENLTSDHEENASLFVSKIGGVLLTIGRMASFSNDARVSKAACQLFWALCEYKELRKQLLSGKVFTALSSAIECHEGNSNVTTPAREAIKLLLKD